MLDETPLVRSLHSLYERNSRRNVTLDMQKIAAWNSWRSMGWTEKDLLLVIDYLKVKIGMGRKWESCLQFKNLIGNTSNFEEELAEARAMARVPRTGERERVLRATGREERKEKPARSAGDVIAGANAFVEFKEWRKRTGL